MQGQYTRQQDWNRMMRKLGTLNTLTVHTPTKLQRLQMGSGNKERSGERKGFYLLLLPAIVEDSLHFYAAGKYIIWPQRFFMGLSATFPPTHLAILSTEKGENKNKCKNKCNLFFILI